MDELGEAVLAEYRARLATYRAMAERALAQVDDAAFFAALDQENNPLALQVKHVGGNLRSRFTDYLHSDGEKPDRRRDGEFELHDGDTRDALMALWATGWARLEGTLAGLTPADLLKAVTIRGEPHTVVQSLARNLAHVAYHVGQIVLLAKHAAGPGWQTLSVPRGQSEQFGAALRAQHAPPPTP